MLILLSAVFSTLFRSRAALELEHIALRHQIGVLKRSARKRPKLTAADRLFWVFLSRVWGDWRSALDNRQTRDRDRLASQGISPFLDLEDPARTRRASASSAVRSQPHPQDEPEEPDVAPRIHGELLKLGIDIGETSVSKYMVRRRKRPSQT